MNISLRKSIFFGKPLIFTLIFALIISIFANPVIVNAESTELSQEEINAIASGAFYNRETGLYEYDKNVAVKNGAEVEHANAMGIFLESLSREEVQNLNKDINFDPSVGDDEVSTRAFPVILIPIAKFLVGTVGAVIITEVTLYGIGKACQNLEGKYGFFDDFCKTRGYI